MIQKDDLVQNPPPGTVCGHDTLDEDLRPVKCPNQATTARRSFRWGNKKKREPAVVWLDVPLCAACAVLWDENESISAAEGSME